MEGGRIMLRPYIFRAILGGRNTLRPYIFRAISCIDKKERISAYPLFCYSYNDFGA